MTGRLLAILAVAMTALRVRRALPAMPPEDEAARTARINGFVEPLSLESMKAAMGGLGIPPFDKPADQATQAGG